MRTDHKVSQNQTLKHILDLAEENTKGLDGYEMIAEWARNAIDLAGDLDTQSEVSASHAGDSRCVCTDGREAERDVCEPCI